MVLQRLPEAAASTRRRNLHEQNKVMGGRRAQRNGCRPHLVICYKWIRVARLQHFHCTHQHGCNWDEVEVRFSCGEQETGRTVIVSCPSVLAGFSKVSQLCLLISISNLRNELQQLCQTQQRHLPSQAAGLLIWVPRKIWSRHCQFCCCTDGLTQPGARRQLEDGCTTWWPSLWSLSSPCFQPEKKGVARNSAKLRAYQWELLELHILGQRLRKPCRVMLSLSSVAQFLTVQLALACTLEIQEGRC